MPPKRQDIGRLTNKSRRTRKKRLSETEEERAKRNEQSRLQKSKLRAIESSKLREALYQAMQAEGSKSKYAKKKALMKPRKRQLLLNESFQDYSREMPDMGSVPTTSRQVPNPYEENKRISAFSQNTIIMDSFAVIKTEVFDPSEKIKEFIFQNGSRYATTTDSMPAVDSCRTTQKFLLPNIKVEPES